MSKWKKHVYRKRVDKNQAFVHSLKIWIKGNDPSEIQIAQILDDVQNLDVDKL
jgi:hypothetical protein